MASALQKYLRSEYSHSVHGGVSSLLAVVSSPAHQHAPQECTAVPGPSLGTIPNTTGPSPTVHCRPPWQCSGPHALPGLPSPRPTWELYRGGGGAWRYGHTEDMRGDAGGLKKLRGRLLRPSRSQRLPRCSQKPPGRSQRPRDIHSSSQPLTKTPRVFAETAWRFAETPRPFAEAGGQGAYRGGGGSAGENSAPPKS